jgi:hypothetical protein
MIRFYVYVGRFRIAVGLGGRYGLWWSAGRVPSNFKLNEPPWAKRPPQRRIPRLLRAVIVAICQMAVLVTVAYKLATFKP